jgi:polysaccharide export outer membrane protein
MLPRRLRWTVVDCAFTFATSFRLGCNFKRSGSRLTGKTMKTTITRKRMLKLLLVLGLASISVAQSSPAGPTTGKLEGVSSGIHPDAPNFQQRDPRYRLRKGDSFDLQFAFSPEFNQAVAVQPDGYITLKSVGTILVEGQTIPELTNTIKAAYNGILHDPLITIALKDFEKPYFIAAGQVEKPGKYELRSDLTLTEGLAVAGGTTDASKHSQVVLFRPVPNKAMYEARVINVKKLLKNHDLNEDVQLHPGDMVYVPQNGISKIRRYLPTSSMGLYANPMLY